MASAILYIGCMFLAILPAVLAADPDPVADFSLPNKTPAPCSYSTLWPIPYPWPMPDPKHNVQQVSAPDFVFRNISAKTVLFSTAANFTSTAINRNTFPILNDQGISFVLLNYPVGAQNPPHVHPRATEILLVISGQLTVGLSDTTPKPSGGPRFFRNVISRGEVTVFPRGLPHFQINRGKTPVIAIAALSSSNPGTARLQDALAVFAPALAM